MFGSMAGQSVALAVALCVVMLGKALASVWLKLIEESSRSRRLGMALHGSEPVERPDIIRACSQLEGNALGATDAGGREADDGVQMRQVDPHDERDREDDA